MADVVQEQVTEPKPEQAKVLNGEAEEKEEADPSEETAKKKKKKKKKNKSAAPGKSPVASAVCYAVSVGTRAVWCHSVR